MSNEELAVKIQAGSDELMGELWEQVVAFVEWKARRVMTALDLRGNPCGVTLEDLTQSGYFALVKAVETYEPATGSFISWLAFHLKTTLAEVTGYRTKMGQNEPLNNSFSLDKPVDDESDGTTFGELVPDPTASDFVLNIEESLWRKQLHEAMEAALAGLPEKSEEILRLRYYQGLTLEDIGETRGTTRERIRQIETKALRQLRKPSVACKLFPFVEFDFYCGTGLGAFQRDGMSVQERYLVIQEERKEREEKKRKERYQFKYEEIMEQGMQEAHARVAQMTPEEKRALLAKYLGNES